jgi:hypothetical protein
VKIRADLGYPVSGIPCKVGTEPLFDDEPLLHPREERLEQEGVEPGQAGAYEHCPYQERETEQDEPPDGHPLPVEHDALERGPAVPPRPEIENHPSSEGKSTKTTESSSPNNEG